MNMQITVTIFTMTIQFAFLQAKGHESIFTETIKGWINYYAILAEKKLMKPEFSIFVSQIR